MKYIFPLIRNVDMGDTGYPMRIEAVGQNQIEAIHEAIRILGLKPNNDNYEGDKYSEVFDSFSLDTTKTVKPIIEKATDKQLEEGR